MSDHPSFWPALLFPFALGAYLVCSRSPRLSAWLIRQRARWFIGIAACCLGLYLCSAVTYLSSASFLDLYESQVASLASLAVRGDAVYPDHLLTQERYATPYGPFLYLTVGLSQWLLGASVWSSKLPGALAGLLAVAGFWVIIRRQSGSRAVAFAVAGLEAALFLALRQATFWTKADPLILLAATAGLFAAWRRGWGWSALLGFCLGAAIGLKPHAAAYFLPVLLIAHGAGWRAGDFWKCGAAAALTAAAPFVLAGQEFSLANYLAFLGVTAREGWGWREAFGFWRWAVLLGMVIVVADRVTGPPGGEPPTAAGRRLRRCFCVSLALAIALVAVPGCAVGAGQGHLMPLIPSFLLAAGNGLARGSFARWRPASPLAWRALASAAVLACALVSTQTAWRLASFRHDSETGARACRREMHSFLNKYAHLTVLTGFGGDADLFPMFFRQEAVFAGHPVGLDVAAVMDAECGGVPEPVLARFVREIHARHQRQMLWLLPRGSVPFSITNVYNSQHAENFGVFRRDFLARFELRERAEFYDVYFPKDHPLP